MNIGVSTQSFRSANAPALVVAVFKDEQISDGILQELDELTNGVVRSILENKELTGKDGETAFVHLAGAEGLTANRLLLVGVGAAEDYSEAKIAQFAGVAARFLRAKGVKDFAVVPRAETANAAQNVAQGIYFSVFELDKYRTKDKEERLLENVTIIIEGADEKQLAEAVKRGQILGESINFTRDLCNEPGNYLTPTEMANRAEKMAEEAGLKCEILEDADCEKLGMGSFLSVGDGSSEPSKFIVLRYEPENAQSNNQDFVALVGKGITFDTGGISIKAADGMEAMKYDMSGAGAVLGAMRAIGLLKPNVPVLGIVAASENMPDGKATKPGDIVTAMNGKTIEVINTDAEGRLVLADAVTYAQRQGATHIVDMATLTGAVVIALGDVNTGVLGTDQAWIDEIIGSGKEVGEKIWQLPLDKEYFEQFKSPIADMRNISTTRKAGTIIGAAFISEFAEGAKWAHLDIAGTAWYDDVKPHRAKGPTGVPIKTLVNLIEKRSNG